MFYLYGSLSIVSVLIILLCLRKDLLKQALIPAILFAPFGPISEIMFFRDYWAFIPVLPQLRMFGHIFYWEDVIYAFGVVGIISIIYDVLLRKKPKSIYQARVVWAFAISISMILLFIIVSQMVSINSIFVSSFFNTLATLVIFFVRKDLIKLALVSSLFCWIGAFLFYFTILNIPGAIEFLLSSWKLPLDQATLKFFGIPIPLTEILWAVTMGFYFSIIYKFGSGSGYE